MPWTHGPLTLYHGCDHVSSANISIPVPPNRHGIRLASNRPFTDFGQGFYTTTSFNQAKYWANNRCRRRGRATDPWLATVLRFDVDRNQLASLEKLCFVIESSNSDYWDLVQHCRTGVGNHLLRGSSNYDVVFGPVSLWPQKLVIKDCDQISFHTSGSLLILPTPTIVAQGTPNNPLLP
jgi:hypothetical protein